MAELLVNTGAILDNYRRYAAHSQVIPVLKGNGYGLGAARLRDLLRSEGATLFACATPEEALELAQPDSDLLLLSCVHDMALLRTLLQRRVIASVESLAQAQAIDALHMDARVHLAVDTGFGRFGFPPEERDAMRRVFALEDLRVCGIFRAAACDGGFPGAFGVAAVVRGFGRSHEAFPGLRHQVALQGDFAR